MMNILNDEANQTQKRSSFFESTDPKPTAPKPEGGGQTEHSEARTKPVDEAVPTKPVKTQTKSDKDLNQSKLKGKPKIIYIPRDKVADARETKLQLSADTRSKIDELFTNKSIQTKHKTLDKILNDELTKLIEDKKAGRLRICYPPTEPEEAK